jgi:CRISPR-associated protein Csm1
MKKNILQVSLTSLLFSIRKLQTYLSGSEKQCFVPQTETFPFDPKDLLSPEVERYINGSNPTQWAISDDANALRVIIADQLSVQKQKNRKRGDQNSYPHLRSIFDFIQMGSKGKRDQGSRYHSFKPLSLTSESIFPHKDQTEDQEDLEALLKGLIGEAEKEFSNPETYLENLLSAFQKYAWCIPSPGCPTDVSLYDHARITSALAACLTDFNLERLQDIAGLIKSREVGKGDQADDEPLALLVGGDFSGIQSFIYTLSAKRAAKTLRGRSFYLQLLTEAILRFVLGKLGLSYANVIYSGGGHFFLLVPTSSGKLLPGIQKEITEKVLRQHGTSLYFSLGWTGVPISGFLTESISPVWAQMHREMQRKKRRRYSDFNPEQLAAIFEPLKEGGNPDKVCAVCGCEDSSVKAYQGYDDDVQNSISICALCNSFAEQIGGKLPKAEWVRMSICEPGDPKSRQALDLLEAFGLQVRLDDQPFEGNINHQFIWLLNDNDIADSLSADSAVWLHYSVNDIPLDGSRVISFEDIEKRGPEGISRLGVLRMDIDNLGKIFKEGLKDEMGLSKGSLVRLATLSWQISLFFEGWIKQILHNPDYAQSIYAVYSGGDDLFLIGPWQFMPDLALEIVEDLNQYTGHNPDIHLSGGLSFIHGKYPIHAAAEDAGELEDKAKTKFGAEKNAFAFLDGVWHWETFKVIKDCKDLLLNIVNLPNAPRNLLHLIQNLDSIRIDAEKEREGEKPLWGRWMWMGDYHLKRMVERARANPELKQTLETLREEMHKGKYPYENLHLWATAARWAELIKRKG